MVVFAGAARGMPVTSDTRLLKMYLAHADPKTENPGGTAIGKALKMSLELLLEARRGGAKIDAPPTEGDEASETPQALDEADQVIILLTDGEDNASEPLAMAEEARKLIDEVEEMGGMTAAVESGMPKMRIEESAALRQARIDRGEEVIVGVNRYQPSEETAVDILDIDNTRVREAQIARLQRVRAQRDEHVCQQALSALREAAVSDNGELLAAAIAAARARASVGEISSTLEDVFLRLTGRSLID